MKMVGRLKAIVEPLPLTLGSPEGLVHNLLMRFFTADSSKPKVPEGHFSDIVIT